jgi:threonine dehydratase
MPLTLDHVRAARERLRGAIYHSPCPFSLSLSRLCGATVYCKLDHLQMTGSFKERGARNKLLTLDAAHRKAGVVAASAGNHALGLAYHGRELGVPVTVVMPSWAPLVKVTNCRSFGAEVIQHGQSFHEARALATRLAEESGRTFVPAFDDLDVMAGQGTLGLEILEDVPDVEAIVTPVGGGGLIAGVGTAVKALRPDVRVIGVEPQNAPTLHDSLAAGRLVHVDTKPTLADGLAVAEAGRLCFEVARRVVDRILLVDEPMIARSVLRLLELEKTVVEGAGAVPLAAALDPTCGLAGKKVVLVLCGGNIDVTTLGRIIDRGLAADGRLCRLTVLLRDRPGTLAALTAVLAATGASIEDVTHDRNFGPPDVATVPVSCVLETRDAAHAEAVRRAVVEAGFEVAEEDVRLA